MTVVSDTSPLNYLVLIRAVDLLPALFERIVVPPAVVAELEHPGSPEAVRRWVQSKPPWLDVLAPTPPLIPTSLGPGETAAMSLALELRADAILLDDRRARTTAIERGLNVVGTLAVLFDAGQRKLIDFEQAVATLSATSIRLHPTVLADFRKPSSE